jgi:hypothetical protein
MDSIPTPEQIAAAAAKAASAPRDDDFQDCGEAARQAAGIDGTAGDAQDVRHHFVTAPGHVGCLLCGLAPSYRNHIDRPLACGFCFEEDGEEIHPHPECPTNNPAEPDMQQNPDGTWTPSTPAPLHPGLDFEVYGTGRGPFRWEAWSGMNQVATGTARTRLGLQIGLLRARRKHAA